MEQGNLNIDNVYNNPKMTVLRSGFPGAPHTGTID